MNINIRAATHRDQDAIHSVHWSAFSEDERALVSKLAVDLLLEETSPNILSLVAEIEGNVVGHVAFSPASIQTDENLQGYILGPLGVVPDYQKRRLGTNLVETGMQILSDKGVDILFVYGDPKYYGRFGFSADAAERYKPLYKLEYPFGWQAIAFNEHLLNKHDPNENEPDTTSSDLIFVSSLSDPALW